MKRSYEHSYANAWFGGSDNPVDRTSPREICLGIIIVIMAIVGLCAWLDGREEPKSTIVLENTTSEYFYNSKGCALEEINGQMVYVMTKHGPLCDRAK